MNLFDLFQRRVAAVVGDLAAAGRLPENLDLSRVVVEPPRDASHGDLATNAAMVLAKEAKTNPRALAAMLAEALAATPGIAQAEMAGPGFINLTLVPSLYHDVLKAILTAGTDFGRAAPPAGGGPVNVEYVSANPTGPLHVGHGRGAVFGDALASLLAFAGYSVTREYYINDAGGQIEVLARSAFLRYREALGEDIGAIPEGLYPGDYLKPVGTALAERFGPALTTMPETEWLPIIRDAAIDAMMAMIRDDLAALGIHHDVFFSERTLHGENGGAIKQAIDDLTERGYVYRGRVPPPKGQLPEDWEDREQLLFRATEVGDDIDRPLMKSDGSYTYFAADVAYLEDKHARGFRELIYVLGADHGGYVKRLQAVARAIGGGEARAVVLLCQLVRLLRHGEPVKMSKRSGDFVTLREVIDEVGRDAVRFMMLFRKNDAPLDFDLAKVVEQSKDNPVFYVQYAHARCASVFRQAAETAVDVPFSREALAFADFSRLNDEAEIDLLRTLAQYPRIVQASAASHEPHRVAFFLYELASTFHSLWNKGKDAPQLRFINSNDRESTSARLALVLAVRSVLASGLAILGVAAPEEMR
ncbi:arginine--tRNA ligase [Chelatococcus sp. GCM10030263]|uniref:arginine--tRNA ligase n=1 Tax=Chelatococcus sp. GCM10030263 TaxID=3273387 RepID=UPI0036112CB0